MKLNVVSHIPTLKSMEKAGFIVLHNQTGSKITDLYGGKPFTCCYINDGKDSFEFRNRIFVTKFIDGCFCPYVFEVVNAKIAYNISEGKFAFIPYNQNDTSRIDQDKYFVEKI